MLEQGFSVKAAVRTDSKANFLKELFISQAKSLETIIVRDFITPGTFDVAVQGVDAIIHAAAPVGLYDPNTDPADYIDPAVKGNVELLQSALNVPTIKRIVFTSSAVTIFEPRPAGHVYDEVKFALYRQIFGLLRNFRLIGLNTH